MFLTSLEEYTPFLIIFLSVILGIVLVYFIFFAPKNRKKEDSLEELNKPVQEVEETNEEEMLFQDSIPNSEELPGNSILDASDSNEDVIVEQILNPTVEPEKEVSSSYEEEKEIILNEEPVDTENLDETFTTEEESQEEEIKEKPEEEVIQENEIKEETEKPEEVKDEEEVKELGKYHVLYRKDDGKWYIKREGSDKTLRVLETQAEAIAWATIKALNQDTAIVIHKRDGKIRKQNY